MWDFFFFDKIPNRHKASLVTLYDDSLRSVTVVSAKRRPIVYLTAIAIRDCDIQNNAVLGESL